MSQVIDRALGHVHAWILAQEVDTLSDRALLDRFVAGRDEAAFATVVRRHAALVAGVCHRCLRSAADAEDAFQATFLTLARKAASLSKTASVSCWLHGVAVRIAGNLRRESRRRQARERQAVRPVATVDADVLSWGEVKAALDEELAQLPEKYRTPLVLCYLEGKSRDEAATQLGWPAGTLHGRLERGRRQLRIRLEARGISLGVGLAVALPAAERVSAAAALSLARAVVRPESTGGSISPVAIRLADSVLRSMRFSAVRLGGASLVGLLLVGLALAFGAAGMHPAPSSQRPAAAQTKPTRLVVPTAWRIDGKLTLGILSIDPLTGMWKKLADNGEQTARVSPDRQTVVFERDDAIWNCDTGGTNAPGKLFDWPNGYGGPIYAPAGKHLYVSKIRSSLGAEVWLHETWQYDADGRNPVKLKLPAGEAVLDVSPDGNYFLTRTRLVTRANASDLRVMKADGTGARRLSPPGGFNEPGRFSPDGRRVVYCRQKTGERGVWVVDVDGKNGKRVFGEDGMNIEGCCWSPDGKRLAVVASEFGEGGRLLPGEAGRWRIEIMDADGHNRRELNLKESVWMLRRPDWHQVAE
jgi:RNA polymerase sigma factor (sigma-70 family)